MGKSIALVVRLPKGVYDEIKKAVDEKNLASSYSGFCRQVVIERLSLINSQEAFDKIGHVTEPVSETSDSNE